jgi:predicted kinase
LTAPLPERRAWLVMVTGKPGSGKTTLGLKLSAHLRVPFISRDQIRGGLLATAGLWTNDLVDPPPREAAVGTFVAVVTAASTAGVSLVAEFVVTPERQEDFAAIEAAAKVIVVLAISNDSAARAEQRDGNDPLLRRPEVLASLGHESTDDYLAGTERALVAATAETDFDLPLLRVRTDDGYDPPLDKIVDWIINQTRS